MRADQTVSEMVAAVLARQAEALSDGTGRPLEGTFAVVTRTSSRRLLGELADGPHRHEKAADSQAGLLKDREARRPERLRDPENGREAGGAGRHSWLARYVDRLGGTDGREEYHALLRERFAALRG